MEKDFKKKKLKNGMTLLFEKRNVPVVSILFAVKNGGNNELLKEKGISHFIEHMLYKGTTKRSAKQIATDIEKNGGELNGFTSEEITGYWCKMPSDKVDIALDVLADLVKNPLFDKVELEKERKVIFEEMNLYKDNPRLHVFDEIQKCLYGGVMDISIIGTRETMASITRERLLEQFQEIYTSENMILCVVGDVDFKDIVSFAENSFEKKQGKISNQEIILKNEIKLEKRKGIDQANLIFAYHVPFLRPGEKYVAKLLSTMMAGGMSSRLFSEIREKRNLAYAIKGDLEAHKEYAYSWIYIGTDKKNIEEIKKVILQEFEEVSKNLTEEELSSIKDQLIGQYKISMEDSQVQMVNLLINEISGKAEDFYDFEENIKRITLQDVKTLASWVKEGKYSFFALVPEN